MKDILKDFENSIESNLNHDSADVLKLYYQSLEKMKIYDLRSLIEIYK